VFAGRGCATFGTSAVSDELAGQRMDAAQKQETPLKIKPDLIKKKAVRPGLGINTVSASNTTRAKNSTVQKTAIAAAATSCHLINCPGRMRRQ